MITILIIACLIFIISIFFNRIDNYFQLSFFATWFFTKKWENVESITLSILNRNCVKIRNKNTIKDRIYRDCVELLNKKHNYTYKTGESEF